MAAKLLTERDGSVPPLLPLTQYQRAPFFVEEDAFHRQLYPITGARPSQITADPFLLQPEFAPVDQSPVVVPDSVLRLRIERGDFPFCVPDFQAPSGYADDWEDWTQHVLDTPHLKARLKSAGLYRAIEAFQSMKLQKNVPALLTLLSRWSLDTHTFVAAWGEFTITLEDICQLTGLDAVGRNSMSTQLSTEEADILNTLQKWYSEYAGYRGTKASVSGTKSSYVQWQRYIYRDMERVAIGKAASHDHKPKVVESKLQSDKAFLAAYIAAFLSRFLLTGKPTDCPSKLLFVLAARLSLGKRIPLASLVLGNLYVWLDQLHLDMARSMGRYDCVNFAPTMILMAFLFERFPYFSARPQMLAPESDGSLVARICKWAGRTTNSVLAAQIDEEERSCFRPYSSGEHVFCHEFFEARASIYQHPSSNIVDDMDKSCASTIALIMPSFLPVLVDWGEAVTIYNPHRVARQFGYDQGVPQHSVVPTPGAPMTYDMAWGNFTRRGALLRYKKYDGTRIPSLDRVGAVTENWNLHWRRQANSFLNYTLGDPVHPGIVPVRVGDDTLRIPRKHGRVGDWQGNAAPSKRVLPYAPHIPSGVARKSTGPVEGKGKEKMGEGSVVAEENVFEPPDDDEDDNVPLLIRQKRQQERSKESPAKSQKKKRARSPKKPRASKRAAQEKIAAQASMQLQEESEEIVDLLLQWALEVLSEDVAHLPVIKDREIEIVFKDLMASSWDELPDTVIHDVKKALSKNIDDKAGQEVLANVFRAAEAVEEFSGILVSLRMEIDDSIGLSGENVKPISDEFFNALRTAHQRYIAYLN